MKKNRLLNFCVVVLFSLFALSTSFAALSTVYVDVTNGSDTYTGENPTNSPSGTGPKATINGGLDALANGGKLVIFAGTYPNPVNITKNSNASKNLNDLTIELRQLNLNDKVELTDVAGFTFDISGGSLTLTTTNGTEYIDLSAGDITLTNGNVAISNSNNFVLKNGATIKIAGTAAFTDKAPKKTSNVSLSYTGGGTFTAGPEAKYGSYGTGTITVAKTAGSKITFPDPITAVASITLTSGDADFNGAITTTGVITITAGDHNFSGNVTTGGGITLAAGTSNFAGLTLSANVDDAIEVTGGNATFSGAVNVKQGDILNSGTGTVTFNSSVALAYADAAAAETDIAQVENSSTGAIVFNGTTKWDGIAKLTANRDFSTLPAISNSSTGNVNFAGVTLANPNVLSTDSDFSAIITAQNTSTGTLTLGTVIANLAYSSHTNTYVQLNVENILGGTVNLDGNIRGNLENKSGAGTVGRVNLTGATTVGGLLVNNADNVIAMGVNTLTLGGAKTHVLQSGSEITGTGKVLVTGAGLFNNSGAAGIASISNLEVGSSGSLAMYGAGGAKFKVTGNLSINNNLTLGSFGSDGLLTVEGSTVLNSGTLTVDAVTDGVGTNTLTVNNFTQSGGTIDLNAGGAADADAGVIDIKGNFNRTSGTFTATDANAELKFTGTVAQTFNPGPLLQVDKLTFNNTAASVALGASPRVSGNVMITTGSNVTLGTLNIILNANNASIINNGTYTASGGGGVIFGGLNTVSGGVAATGQKIGGTGTYSYLTVDVGTANTVTTAGLAQNIKFNGVLTLRSGDLTIATSDDFAPTGTSASIVRNLVAATGSANGIVTTGTFNTNVPTDYDLTYEGALTANKNITAGASEFDQDNVRNLTINTTTNTVTLMSAAALTVKGNVTLGDGALLKLDNVVPFDLDIKGILTINKTAVLSGGDAGMVKVVKLSTNGLSHTIIGEITADSPFQIAGTGITVIGSTEKLATNGHKAEVKNVDIKANASATFTNIQRINGNLTTGANSALTLGMAAPDAGNDGIIVGAITLGGTSFTMASDMEAQAGVVHNKGTVNFGSYNLTLTSAGTYTRAADASATYTSTTGYLIQKFPGLILNMNGGTIPRLKIDASTTLGGHLTVSDELWHKSGSITSAGNNITIQNALNFEAGDFTGAGKIILAGSTITAGADYAISNLEVNTTGTATLATNDVTAPISYRKFTISGVLTHTKGTLAIGGNNIELTGTGKVYDRTTGDLTATTGELQFKGGAAQTFDFGDDFVIPNLVIDNAAGVNSSSPTKAFTVSKNLDLANGVLTTNPTKLVLGDGVTIIRRLDAAKLANLPSFGSDINVKYIKANDGTAKITTDKELPGAVKDLTINNADANAALDDVMLNADLTVTGTLYLVVGELDEGTKALTLGAGATLNRQGTATTDQPTVSTYHLVYSGSFALNTTANDFLPGLLSFTISTTGGVSTTLNASQTIDGPFTLNAAGGGAKLNLNGNTLTVNGNVTVTAGLLTNGASGTAKLKFAGAAAQEFAVPAAGLSIPEVATKGPIELEINNSSAEGITLTGGNLTMDNTLDDENSIIRFVNGILKTGDNIVTLWQASSGTNQPVQGFVREAGHIVGNVKKFIDKSDLIAISMVEFPTGTLAGSPAYYRPAVFYFKNTPQASFNLTVNHKNENPGGENGLPLQTDEVLITNYPDFHWTVQSDISLSPSYKFDMELQAEGYTEYVKDKIQNVRLIRRNMGDINNQWRMQGIDVNYDNYTKAEDWPVVKVIDATGGILTSGSIFTLSQSNKAPSFTTAPASVSVNENDSLDVVYEATDPDIGQTLTYSVVGTLPPFATFATKSGKGIVTLKPGYDHAGEYSVRIRVTDELLSVDTSTAITVNNVNRKPAFVKVLPDTLVSEGTNIVYDYNATDGDGESLTFAVVAAPTGANINATTGVFSYTPAKGLTVPRVDTIIVSVTDKIDVVKDTAKVTVIKPGAPYFTDVMPDITVNSGNEVSYTYVAVDPNASTGDIVSYSLVDAPAGAVINASTGVFKWTPNVDQVGKNNIIVKASDQGGLFSLDTAVVTVKSALLGDVSGNGAIGSYDATLVLQHVAGMITLAGDSLTLADVSGNGTVGSLDASYILQYVAGIITKFPAEGGLGKILASTGEVKWEAPIAIDKEGTIALPVFLKNASNVYAIQFTANIDPVVVNIESVKSLLPEGWLMVHNVSGGKLSVAMAGTTPLAEDREIAVISLKVSSKNVESSITGEAIVNENEVTSLEKVGIRQIPNEYKLSQNYPNPFNPTTNISFQIKDNGRVMITIYDILGKKVRTLVDENLNAGYYTVQWNGLSDNGMSLSSGTYFYKIDAGSFTSVKRMLLIK